MLVLVLLLVLLLELLLVKTPSPDGSLGLCLRQLLQCYCYY